MPALDFPSSPTVGQEHDHDGSIWMWDGSKWMAVMPDDPSVVVSETAPTDVPSGTIWFDSITAQTLVLYGNSWVEIGATSSATTGGGGGDGGGGGGGGGDNPTIIDSDDILIEPDGRLLLVNDSVTVNNSTVALGQSVTFDTNSVAEGTANKYFTVDRAVDATANALALGTHTNISVTYDDEEGSIDLVVDPTPNDATVTTPKLNLEYADQASFPLPINGRIAYSIADGAIYFAHNSTWAQVANQSAVSLAISVAEANSSTYTNTSISNTITQLQTYTDNAVQAEANARIAADSAGIDSDQAIIAAAMFT